MTPNHITITHFGAETCSGMPCPFPTSPAVIIAGSGMCTGGRIVNHLKHGLDDPKNEVCREIDEGGTTAL